MADYKEEDIGWDTEPAQSQSEEGKKSRSSKRKQKKKRSVARILLSPVIYVAFVLLVSALLAGEIWKLFADFCAFEREGIHEYTIEITAEDDLSTIANKLQETGLINYPWFFEFVADFTDAEASIGVGTYTLNTDMDYKALINGMRSGSGNLRTDTVRVTIPEGYTVIDTINLLSINGVNTEEALLEVAHTAKFNYDFINNDTEDLTRLEGYLFPDTYDFYIGHSPQGALERLLDNFDRKMDEDLMTEVTDSIYTLNQILTIASLIEKETDGSDQAKIASVIYNRLGGGGGANGLLQVDASLRYVLPEGAALSESLDLDSPYNLYKNKGLPPTPIANPGLAAIKAALHPEETNYYYYALGVDGKHHFSSTYEEHNAFVHSSEYAGNASNNG